MYGGDSQLRREIQRRGRVDADKSTVYGTIATLKIIKIDIIPMDRIKSFAAQTAASNLVVLNEEL